MSLSELTSLAEDASARPAARRRGKRSGVNKVSATAPAMVTEPLQAPDVSSDARDDGLAEMRFDATSGKPKSVKPTGWPAYSFWPMGLTLGLYVLCAYVSNLGFPVVASFGGLLCLGYWRYARAFAAPLISLTLLLVWGALNSDPKVLVAAFASTKAFGETQWSKTAFQLLLLPPLVLAAWRMPAREAHWLMTGLKWAMAALALLMLSESVTGAALYQWISERIYQPIRPDLALVKTSLPTYQLVWVVWPLLMVSALSGHKRVVWLIIAALLVAPIVMSANAVTLGLIASTIVFFAAKYWPKNGDGPEQVLALLFASAIMLFPSVVATLGRLGVIDSLQSHLPGSWADRVEIWERAAAKMFEWPLSGWGFDYSRHFKGVPLHPHNVALQSGLELGFVGLILVALIWAQISLRIGKPYVDPAHATGEEGALAVDEAANRFAGEAPLMPIGASGVVKVDTRPYMLAAVTPYFVFAFMSFGMWQEWFVAMGGVMVAVCLLACRSLDYDAHA
jgi:hypothetical protein